MLVVLQGRRFNKWITLSQHRHQNGYFFVFFILKSLQKNSHKNALVFAIYIYRPTAGGGRRLYVNGTHEPIRFDKNLMNNLSKP